MKGRGNRYRLRSRTRGVRKQLGVKKEDFGSRRAGKKGVNKKKNSGYGSQKRERSRDLDQCASSEYGDDLDVPPGFNNSSPPLAEEEILQLPDDDKVDMEPASMVEDEIEGKANTALGDYNERNNADFKLEKVVGGYSVLGFGFWYHVSFMARSGTGNPRSSGTSKLFFAELCMGVGPKPVYTTRCSILNPKAKIGIKRGCSICHSKILHPCDGLCVGLGGRMSKDPREADQILC